MNRELCFRIGDKELYLEQVLVSFNDIPIFFVCKDDAVYYVVLCADIEQLKYFIVRLSDVCLCNMLHGNVSMREVFTMQKYYWEILSGEEIGSDQVTRKPIEEIDCSALPEEGAYFKILTDEVSVYVRKIDKTFFAKKQFKTWTMEWIVYVDNNSYVIELHDLERSRLNQIARIEKYVKLLEKMAVQNIAPAIHDNVVDYSEAEQNILRQDTVIFDLKCSEEWLPVEMVSFEYAA